MAPKILLVLYLFFIFPIGPLHAEAFVFASENEDSFPWISKNGTGMDYFLVQTVMLNLGHKLTVERKPWLRCLKLLQINEVDGSFTGSYKKDRLAIGRYPMINNQLDASRRLHSASYSLYVLNDSNITWDGQKFSAFTGKVGAPSGYSIIEKLKNHKLAVHEVKTTQQLMGMLIRGRISAVAALTMQGDIELANSPNLASKIKKIKIPLVDKPYFLLLSHELVQKRPELAEAIWNEIKNVRESDAYQQAFQQMLIKDKSQ